MDKCFCHLNGLAVKDALARKELGELKPKVNAMYEKPGKTLFESAEGMLGGNVADEYLFCDDIDKYSLVLVDGVLCSVRKGMFYDYSTDPATQRFGFMIEGYYSEGIREGVTIEDFRDTPTMRTTISINIEDHEGEFHIISNNSYEFSSTINNEIDEAYRPLIFKIVGII